MLDKVVAAVEEQAERLVEEFHRPGGPRGHAHHCDVDLEIEERLRNALQAILPAAFAGEETGMSSGSKPGFTWVVDPHDGTYEFMQGRRGSAVSVGLLRGGQPVLGVVCSPMSPDRGRDTIAWAEGAHSILRNGRPVANDLSRQAVHPDAFVWATASARLKPIAWSVAVAPARYIAMPSIAYRMARIAAGDGVATVSLHAVNEYDIAAGMALIAAANGVVLDAEGREVVLQGNSVTRVSGVFAGAPPAARQLARVDWRRVEQEPRREPRVALGFPRKSAWLERGQGVLLGQVVGDSLGSQVEFKSAAEIARLFPRGVRELASGGPYHTIAGQPTDDSEMALTLARTILSHRGFERDKVLDAYREWMQTRPIDIGETTERGLLGLHTTESESNGSLMRVSPIGVWAAGDPARAAAAARQDSMLTHPNPVCVEACAGFCAAIAAGVAGAGRKEMVQAGAAHCTGPAQEAILRGAAPGDFTRGRALVALQNAFHRLASGASVEESLVATVSYGGDTDTNAAIAGALLGALHGRDAFPSRWVFRVLACRPLAEAADPRPRPMVYWPDDVLELAEALLG
ncbi:MAG TPA: inositol monophosphatase family protein [Burkholderiales bacterium]|jgi:ADP-ribosylglycohydrolase/fructose-1,6-bisphosphatase/inositol monophosphatase family enzyme